MESVKIREAFIRYFEEKEHKYFESSSLIPENDPTLLFTVAGMVQFKPMFAGLVSFDFSSAVSIQKCLRVVDLEEVGASPFHDTFFEMLGNFSFNDYFQERAIEYAWEFLTDILKIEKSRLYATVHENDTDAYSIWKDKIGLDSSRIIKMGDKTNFWGPAGSTGACGPSSEIFYDFGPGLEDRDDCSIENECRRYVEVWNLVFPAFNQDSRGKRHPLKNKGVDTGMGLERLAAVMQNKKSIYDTDLFMPIIREFSEITGIDYNSNRTAVNSIADHIRALTFAIADSIIPSNEGRGYVIRRILRRAVRLAYIMDYKEPYLYRLSSKVIDIMAQQYPDLSENSMKISRILKSEEERFLSTIGQGIGLYEEFKEKDSSGLMDGETMFKLYDTFGFPVDLLEQMAVEDGLSIDRKGFESRLEEARERSRADSKFNAHEGSDWIIFDEDVSSFTGYSSIREQSDILMYRYIGDKCEVVFRRTPFYARSGGQVGDTGRIYGPSFEMSVEETYPSELGNVMKGAVHEGEPTGNTLYNIEVDSRRRQFIERNHTATHLLHAALKDVLGSHVKQEGSYVGPGKLRFDFTHFNNVKESEIERVERIVNDKIFASIPLNIEEMEYEEAIESGATAIFTEKYDSTVRVVSIEEFSRELCGGTHVSNTGMLGMFKIISESSVAAGIRRIEALTSRGFYEFAVKNMNVNSQIMDMLDVNNAEQIPSALRKIEKQKNELEDEIAKLRDTQTDSIESSIMDKIIIENSTAVISKTFDNDSLTMDQLRDIMDKIKSENEKAAGYLGIIKNDKLLALCFSQHTDVNASLTIREILTPVKGSGGGREQMAQGSGNVPDNPDDFDSRAEDIIRRVLTDD
ncbi:MAG: alanine--tRNA ligase [bacterium]